ncbi:hypothetical protein [Streptomyces sp. ISL-86]|uniref:hypothetical protein n=1 Tax=Streptomyces sp. ISL-86 TaxID=2819187 RepID=UPI001BEAF2F3|nr:hypothetical protein [Streptomyces sp. ISL-86]MBT2454577.1 hypothetical protein [Streptomyces sp. ISL-86]
MAATGAVAAPVQAAPTVAVAQAGLVCTANDNGVNYRSGPGPEYPVFGTVNRGQSLNCKGQEGSWVLAGAGYGDVLVVTLLVQLGMVAVTELLNFRLPRVVG